MFKRHETPAEQYRKNADNCWQQFRLALTTEDKWNWLEIAEEWQKLAEQVDALSAERCGDREISNRDTIGHSRF